MQPAVTDSELRLPALRQELVLCKGAPTLNGVPTWLIHDPIRHRYFQLSNGAVDLLRRWRPLGLTAYRQHIARETGIEPTQAEVQHIIQFIYANNLSETPPDGNPLSYAAQIKGARQSPLMRALHGYLFFRVPLLRPSRFLATTMPLVAPLYSRVCLTFIAFLTVTGLYLATRQWEAFSATFASLVSWQGAMLYAVALILVKCLHELGHAYTATRFGVRVNTMGIAFMLMMPLLYTDVSDAWRLTSRRRKLMIDAAGLVVELSLAGIATFIWVFLPDGPFRSVIFVVATTSWTVSLLVNLNPFMRFDGYYLLSDAWGVPNLQSRAFAITRWQIREWLFNLRALPPEPLNRNTRTCLIGYTLATWIYRLVLFIGIALLVYHAFFKVLGAALFIVEIIWFIALPITRELIEWWKLRKDIMATTRTYLSLAITAILIAAVVIPWRSTIIIPAMTWSSTEVRLFPSHPARLTQLAISDGDTVVAGQIIAVLGSDDLDHKSNLVERRIRLLVARLNRIAGDTEDLSNRAVLISELEAAQQEQSGINSERRQLTLHAPFAGRIRDLTPNLHPGRYLKTTESLARLVQQAGSKARGYIAEDDLARIAIGASGHFIPDDPHLKRRAVVVSSISPSGTPSIDLKYLASVHGGPILADPSSDGSLKPRASQHLIQFDLEFTLANRSSRGVIHIEGDPESIAASVWRRVLKVLVRESGV